RVPIYGIVTFVMHDLDTLHTFAVSQPDLMLGEIQHLQLTIRLPLSNDEKKLGYGARATMARWREYCDALERAETISSVDLWLDTVEPDPRFRLWSIPEDPHSNPYVFSERLASILTVDLPFNPDRLGVWESVANIEPRFTIGPRGWPPYIAEVGDSKRSRIIKLWNWAEPGMPVNHGSRREGPPTSWIVSKIAGMLI
ncbi:hypothetical protein N0V84_012765, partial [Fusarium piperis]